MDNTADSSPDIHLFDGLGNFVLFDEMASEVHGFEPPGLLDFPKITNNPFDFPSSLPCQRDQLENMVEFHSIRVKANSYQDLSMIERFIHAVKQIKEFVRDADALIQIWVPTRKGNRQVLTTLNQPFEVNHDSECLINYRMISLDYNFPAEENTNEIVGLPGRVFLGKLSEWTPDVRYFSRFEYARVDFAQQFGLRGSLAVPVFERGSCSCLGVIEVVMNAEKIHYANDLERICSALQAVDLTCSGYITVPGTPVRIGSYQAALPEIREILRIACETHKLPLAQTWISCTQQGRGGCRHTDENYKHCVSTVDGTCYINDYCMRGFHEACSEHHLLRGLGVVGQAFATNEPCFSPDITSFRKSEYPLSHHARKFHLRAAVAIRLRSVHIENADFVLEFFLPIDCITREEQKSMLDSLSHTLQKVCKSLRVITYKELEAESKLQTEVFQKSVKQHHQDSALANCDLLGTPTRKSDLNEEDNLCSRKEKTISLHTLQKHFSSSLKDAARNLGVCPTTLKRICRQQGIARWPSKKLKKVDHSMKKLQDIIKSVEGANGAMQLSSLYPDLTKSPSSSSSNEKLSETGALFPPMLKGKSACSSFHLQNDEIHTRISKDNECNLQDQMRRKIEPICLDKSDYDSLLGVKAMYGDKRVRFRLQPAWSFEELKQEIVKRLNIDDASSIYLKYLDDDSEWVLLTCDADLHECVDVCKSSKTSTIRICVHCDHSNTEISSGNDISSSSVIIQPCSRKNLCAG